MSVLPFPSLLILYHSSCCCVNLNLPLHYILSSLATAATAANYENAARWGILHSAKNARANGDLQRGGGGSICSVRAISSYISTILSGKLAPLSSTVAYALLEVKFNCEGM